MKRKRMEIKLPTVARLDTVFGVHSATQSLELRAFNGVVSTVTAVVKRCNDWTYLRKSSRKQMSDSPTTECQQVVPRLRLEPGTC
jgi:hypothetical protein